MIEKARERAFLELPNDRARVIVRSVVKNDHLQAELPEALQVRKAIAQERGAIASRNADAELRGQGAPRDMAVELDRQRSRDAIVPHHNLE